MASEVVEAREGIRGLPHVMRLQLVPRHQNPASDIQV